MLCMIWAIDEAISLSPLWALPSLSLSPCCLMFQFGGSKHSIRQINCLMHVISQTVYERGAPRPGAPPPLLLRPSHSPALHVHTVYSHIDRAIQAQAQTQRRLCAHTCTQVQKHIFAHTHTHTHIHKHRHIYETYTGKYKCTHGHPLTCTIIYLDNHICMQEKPHADIHTNIV